jgi:lytic cellulose monooxygenase (C1-hydroxylating)
VNLHDITFTYDTFSFMPYNSPNGQNTIQREWSTFNPIEEPQNSAIICNKPGTPAQRSATVPAGSQIKAHWNQYSHNVGPLIIWMAECPGSCKKWNAQNGRWFKIDEQGLLSGTVGKGNWGSGSMIAKNLTWTIRIPKSLKAGNYLLRTETIAMHSTVAQFYPNCAELNVTGTGSSSPGAQYIARIPGVYSVSGKTSQGRKFIIYLFFSRLCLERTNLVCIKPSEDELEGSWTTRLERLGAFLHFEE